MTAVRDEDRGPLRVSGTPATAAIRIGILMRSEAALEEVCAIFRNLAPDLDVVVGTTAWLELVRSPRFPTDVVVLDYDVSDAISLEGRVRSCRGTGASVLVLSRSDDHEVRRRVLASGASALLSGRVKAAEVVAAVRSVVGGAGERIMLPEVAARLAKKADPRLSLGEEQALRLYVSGRSTREVAAEMNVKYETAKTYLRRVRTKYRGVGRQAGRRAELIERAVEDGYLR